MKEKLKVLIPLIFIGSIAACNQGSNGGVRLNRETYADKIFTATSFATKVAPLKDNQFKEQNGQKVVQIADKGTVTVNASLDFSADKAIYEYHKKQSPLNITAEGDDIVIDLSDKDTSSTNKIVVSWDITNNYFKVDNQSVGTTYITKENNTWWQCVAPKEGAKYKKDITTDVTNYGDFRNCVFDYTTIALTQALATEISNVRLGFDISGFIGLVPQSNYVMWENDGTHVDVDDENYVFTEGDGYYDLEIPSIQWEKMKTETFYLDLSSSSTPTITVQNGWNDTIWKENITPPNDILVDHGDGTYTLEINFTDREDFIDAIDDSGLKFAGFDYTPQKLYFPEPEPDYSTINVLSPMNLLTYPMADKTTTMSTFIDMMGIMLESMGFNYCFDASEDSSIKAYCEQIGIKDLNLSDLKNFFDSESVQLMLELLRKDSGISVKLDKCDGTANLDFFLNYKNDFIHQEEVIVDLKNVNLNLVVDMTPVLVNDEEYGYTSTIDIQNTNLNYITNQELVETCTVDKINLSDYPTR